MSVNQTSVQKLPRVELNKLRGSREKEAQEITAEIHGTENSHNIDVTDGANFWVFEKTQKLTGL